MRILAILLTFFLINNCVLAKEIPVKIRPEKKISTSDLTLLEGDNVNFIITEDVVSNSKTIFKKGQKVSGVITCIENNNYFIEPAKIYIEQFCVINADSRVRLKGIVYKKGSEHAKINEVLAINLIRGGEAHIKPEKDVFIIYFEDEQ